MYLATCFTNIFACFSKPKEKRVVTKKGTGDAVIKGMQDQEDASNIFTAGRGKRRQLLVTAPGTTKASLLFHLYNVFKQGMLMT